MKERRTLFPFATPALAAVQPAALAVALALAACAEPAPVAETPAQAAVAPAESNPAAPLPPPEPAALVGRSAEDIARAMGPPGFRRRDGPAQVWQYAGEGCLLDLFFYSDGVGFRVDHVEVRAANGGEPDGACVAELLAKAARES